PEKKWVDEAIKYADSKDVLIIHAAGNESHNVDSIDNFPSADLITLNTTAQNFISVGASGDTHIAAGKIVADFSNYGKSTVDVFAPGVKIYSTLPGGNQYGFLNGTSMASPVVAGVAALMRSYYPALSAKQIKYAIEKSAENLTGNTAVTVPGTDRKILINELCKTGGFVNADAAMELAATLKPEATDIKKKDKKTSPSLINPKEIKN
ncbi:MAG: S8 family serine peptidase, partial [Panacibacter sp.]